MTGRLQSERALVYKHYRRHSYVRRNSVCSGLLSSTTDFNSYRYKGLVLDVGDIVYWLYPYHRYMRIKSIILSIPTRSDCV